MAVIQDQWECHLLASSNQVRNNDQVKLTVTPAMCAISSRLCPR
jgi:hypothetical protein